MHMSKDDFLKIKSVESSKHKINNNSDSSRAKKLLIMTKYVTKNKRVLLRDTLNKGDGMARLMHTREEMLDVRNSFQSSDGNSLFNGSIQ
jgi:hypothetical protein